MAKKSTFGRFLGLFSGNDQGITCSQWLVETIGKGRKHILASLASLPSQGSVRLCLGFLAGCERGEAGGY